MKYIVIGPVYPYKGGISHYTGLLYKELKNEGHEVCMFSYSFQYPRFLYKKEQKDERNDDLSIQGAEFILHTINPINWVKVARRINKEKADLLIIQWWHPYFAPCYIALGKLIKKTKILFVCHNVFPHERFPMDKLLTKWTLRRGNSFIVHSNMDGRDLELVKKNAKYEITPHPTYNAFKLRGISKTEAKEELGIVADKKVLLFFGFVRKYKGLEYLLKAMPLITSENKNIELWVVGDFGEEESFYTNIVNELGITNNLQLVKGYIADSEVEKYFAACDLVVLPYISATQSGIVQIAYGLRRPVLVTNVGGLPEVVMDHKTGLVIEPESEQEIANAVNEFYRNQLEPILVENIIKEEDRFSWAQFVKNVNKAAGGTE